MINKRTAVQAWIGITCGYKVKWCYLIKGYEQWVRARHAAVKIPYNGKGFSVIDPLGQPFLQSAKLLEQNGAGMVFFG
ncbi:hypothetical protein GOB86_06045 [Acetobacter lambici]|uniref:hypothetical protein n=1 Tax=Acetobacter lambici TaxID=1332824 RepID=UPI001408279E|nr:hypothetical protein [Acetobacter lambici]NHO56631.1 hypothetical protein [Acetobacter lambici]